VQAEVILLPLVGLGLWYLRKNRRVQLACVAWLCIFAAMTLAFPFAGARGGFFHSGASLQTVWWALAPIGLDRIIAWGSRVRAWDTVRSNRVFSVGLVAGVVLLTVVIVYVRVLGGGGSLLWGQENNAYNQISKVLVSDGMTAQSTVMVANPPGFFLASGNPAIALPDGDVHTLLSVATRYGANFVILEAGSIPVGLNAVYKNPEGWVGLKFLGYMEAARVFLIEP
jgi:hypothetical protein